MKKKHNINYNLSTKTFFAEVDKTHADTQPDSHTDTGANTSADIGHTLSNLERMNKEAVHPEECQ